MKVGIADRQVILKFLPIISGISFTLSTLLLFIKIPDRYGLTALIVFIFSLLIIYVFTWILANRTRSVTIKIDGTEVIVKSGDIFKEPGLKAIAFNEYFDTQVDNNIISEKSLNGIFLNSYLREEIAKLDEKIESFRFEDHEVLEPNNTRQAGKKKRYKLGTVYVCGEYILTAMSKFDSSNRAILTMPEYLEFLINFWDRMNKVYAQRSVTTPIFGSGITRIQGHKDISDEDLLKIMLWTFRISEMRFKHPAKLTILVHQDKIDQVNLLSIQSMQNGL